MMRALGMAIFLGLLGAPAAQAQPVKAAATFSILGDLVKNVGGDRVELTVLVGAQGDVHTFEPSPADNMVLAQSSVIFENGFGLEPWLDKMYRASGSKAARVVTGDGVEPITARSGAKQEEDPHIWQDVSSAMIMVERVRDGLSAADPANAAYYKERAEQYLTELSKLDQEIIERLKDIPDERRKIVTSHDSLGYFARRYGFKVIGAGLEAATTEASDPSAGDIARLIDAVKASGTKAVFIENTHSPKLMAMVAREARVQVAPELYTDALGPAGSDGETYIKMMRHNAAVLASELK